MSARKKSGRLSRLAAHLTGLLCLLAVGAVFYGTMVYQLAGEETAPREAGPLRALLLGEGTLLERSESEVMVGGERCRVVTREYRLDGGESARTVSATPAAYIERLAEEGWQPQPMTGFTLAELDAVYERKDGLALLAARDGDAVYLLEAEVSEQALYALGAGARLESE